jgi:hypothetical protein
MSSNSIRTLPRLVTAILVSGILSCSIAWAAPPLDAASAKSKIQKYGINHYLCVQESNGIELRGRILAVNDQSFQMQLGNQPQPVEIQYADVTALQNLGWTHGKVVFLLVGIGAVAGMATYGFVHVHNLENQPLQQPALP